MAVYRYEYRIGTYNILYYVYESDLSLSSKYLLGFCGIAVHFYILSEANDPSTSVLI